MALDPSFLECLHGMVTARYNTYITLDCPNPSYSWHWRNIINSDTVQIKRDQSPPHRTFFVNAHRYNRYGIGRNSVAPTTERNSCPEILSFLKRGRGDVQPCAIPRDQLVLEVLAREIAHHASTPKITLGSDSLTTLLELAMSLERELAMSLEREAATRGASRDGNPNSPVVTSITVNWRSAFAYMPHLTPAYIALILPRLATAFPRGTSFAFVFERNGLECGVPGTRGMGTWRPLPLDEEDPSTRRPLPHEFGWHGAAATSHFTMNPRVTAAVEQIHAERRRSADRKWVEISETLSSLRPRLPLHSHMLRSRLEGFMGIQAAVPITVTCSGTC
jgi:hypothetical protein